MSAKTCLALTAVLIAGLCMPSSTPAPVLHVPSACVNQNQAWVSVTGSKIHLVKFHDQIEASSFGIHLRSGQHAAINVVVLAGSKRHVLSGNVCRRGARLADGARHGTR